MSLRKDLYPDDLEDKIRKIAEPLGFEYTHIELGRFPMKWYETYGYHLKDYIFDRFEPMTWYAGLIKGVFMVLFTFIYLIPFGIWLTLVGEILGAFKKSIWGSKRDRMVS